MASAWRDSVWMALESKAYPGKLGKLFNVTILILIFVSLIVAGLATVGSIADRMGALLYWIKAFAVGVFTLEYIIRVWASASGPARNRPIVGRLLFIISPMMIIDAIAILPFYISALPLAGPYLRALRLLRLVRLLKATRYSRALNLLRETVIAKRGDIAVSAALMAIVIVIASFVLYELEHQAQPEAFSSVPATLWWAVATLTTVGYGDIYPITPWGKLVTAMIAIVCVGLVALPTAILASGFLETLNRQEQDPNEATVCCPQCGARIEPSSP